jgi:hypothetical protein
MVVLATLFIRFHSRQIREQQRGWRLIALNDSPAKVPLASSWAPLEKSDFIGDLKHLLIQPALRLPDLRRLIARYAKD